MLSARKMALRILVRLVPGSEKERSQLVRVILLLRLIRGMMLMMPEHRDMVFVKKC